MSERPEEQPERDELPEVAVAPRRGVSIVWLIPVIAGLIALWLGYTTIMEQGPTVFITFKTAEGLEAGKTKVKYRDVEVGQVEDVEIAEDASHVIVTASLIKGTEPHLTENTRFWVVRPRLGAGGISGLSTLVSGAHIEIEVVDIESGLGDPKRTFTGLEVPPVVLAYEPGRRFLLRADSLGSVGPGSPIHFRGLDVGEVLGYELAEDGRGVKIHAFIKEPHYGLVREESRFWNASGIEVSVGADGVKISTTSLQALLTGGIAFETPFSGASTGPAEEGTVFRLYDDLASVSEAAYTEKTPYVAYFDGSVRGLQVGAPVEFRGIRVGSVTDVALEINQVTTDIRVSVTFQIEPQRVNVLDVTGAKTKERGDPYENMADLVERGLRAQLESGSLLTGQLVVELAFHPDSPAAELRTKGRYPEIPTVPSDLEEIRQSVEQVLANIANLPLEALVEDLRRTIQNADRLIASPELMQSVVSLNKTLDDIQGLVRNIDGKAAPVLTSIEDASEAAEAALLQAKTTLVSADGFVGEKSAVRYDLSQLMKELTEAARSIRFLTDYLEQHPEALIRGKAGTGD
jgi:paraquat-inducible protein B